MSKLKNYDPGMFEIYSGVFKTKKSTTMKFPELKMARSFALRLQRLRRDMRLENHHLLVAAESCTVRVDPATFEVTVEPADARYMDQIQDALKRLHEVSPEIEDHELNHTQIYRPPGGEVSSQAEESKETLPPLGAEDNDRASLSPAQEALKKFMGGGE